MSTEFVLPPSLIAHEAEWTLLDFTGVQQSPLSGAVRTVSRGQRWQARLRWNSMTQDDRHLLSAIMSVVRGKSGRIWIPDPSYRKRGSFPAPEMLTNGSFENGSTSFTAGGSCVLSGHNRTLRMAINGATAPYAYQSVSLVSGVAYALRSCLVDGVNTDADTAGVRMHDGTNTYDSLGSVRGLITASAVAGASGAGTQRVIFVSAGAASGEVIFSTYASLRRCALASGAASAGATSMTIDILPNSTAGLLYAGDRVEIAGEFKTVTFDLNSDGSGVGTLFFEPALRKAVADNSPIIIGEPMMKAIFSEGQVQVSRPGVDLLSDFDFTFMEAS